MAFSFVVEGIDELYSEMDKLGGRALGIAAHGLYEGAGMMADSVSRAINGIRTEPFKYVTGGRKRLPSLEEKAIVANAPHGVAKFRKSGIRVDTSVGFNTSGYTRITWNHARSEGRTKYKMGYNGKARKAQVTEGKSSGVSVKPVGVIVNSINSGTSFMTKQPFARKAFSTTQGPAAAVIESTINQAIDDLKIA